MDTDEGDQRRYLPIDIEHLRAENADLERQLAEAQGLLKELVNAKPAQLRAVMYAAAKYLGKST